MADSPCRGGAWLAATTDSNDPAVFSPAVAEAFGLARCDGLRTSRTVHACAGGGAWGEWGSSSSSTTTTW